MSPVGVFTNPGYGQLRVAVVDSVLTLTYNDVTATLANTTNPVVYLAHCQGQYALLLGTVGVVYSADGSQVTIPALEPSMVPWFVRE